MPYAAAILPTVMMAIGFVIAWEFYIRRPELPVELARQHESLYRFLSTSGISMSSTIS